MDIKNLITKLLAKPTPKTDVEIFAGKIETIRKEVHISATSSFRTTKHNTAVGGVILSKHLKNLAVDVVLDHKEDAPTLKYLCEREKVFYLDEKDHYHLGFLK